jgi:hypothetical protein
MDVASLFPLDLIEGHKWFLWAPGCNGTSNYQCTAAIENLGDFLFLGKILYVHFSGYFDGASTFLTPKLSLAALWTI